MVEFKNVSVKYGETNILKDFSLTINKGEHIAIMGPSGSGKTTVLKLISGLLKPSSGTVTCGTDKISYMFQEPRLVPWLTAAENVNLVLGDSPKSLPEAMTWLLKLGLDQAANKLPAQLSGGMQQRTALARTLAFDAELILLDEPLSALDEETAADVLSLIQEFTKEKTVILVTHNVNHAKMFADTIYVMKTQNT